MTLGLKKLGQYVRRFRRDEDGGPTVEFVLVFMPFMILVVSAFELGYLMTRHVMLERGVDMAVREVRLNTSAQISPDQFRTMICNTAGIIDKCDTQVLLEMRRLDLWEQSNVGPTNLPRAATCRDTNNPAQLAPPFTNGQANEMMVVRACGLFTPMLPEFGLGYYLSRIRPDGYYPLVAITAFVMEPI